MINDFRARLNHELGFFGWYSNGFSHQFSPIKINRANAHYIRNIINNCVFNACFENTENAKVKHLRMYVQALGIVVSLYI